MQLFLEELQILAKAASDIGVDAFATNQVARRLLWNERFGPAQRGLFFDFLSESIHSKILFEKLSQQHPEISWIAKDAGGDLRSPLLWRRVRVFWNGEQVQFIFGEGAENSLRQGILALDENLLERSNPELRAVFINEAVQRARRALFDYPALQLKGILKDSYKEYGGASDNDFLVDTRLIQEAVLAQEKAAGGRSDWKVLSEAEASAAVDVVNFYRKADRVASAAPSPRRTALPEKLVEFADQLKAEVGDYIPAPAGFGCWFHYVASTCEDKTYLWWVAAQYAALQGDANCLGGVDGFLESVFTLRVFKSAAQGKTINNPQGHQKVTHQGTTLAWHLFQTAMQLTTDDLSISCLNKEQVRLALRLAALFHDGGKLHNAHAAGGHEAAGAAIFRKIRPSWMSWREFELAAWAIRTHDLLGRLARGITEKQNGLPKCESEIQASPTYLGALDAAAVRRELNRSGLELEDALQLNKAMWLADIAAVPSLRWLLGVENLLVKVVLSNE